MTEDTLKTRRTLKIVEEDARFRFHFFFPLLVLSIILPDINTWHHLEDSLSKVQMVSATQPPDLSHDKHLVYVSGRITTRHGVREPFADTSMPYAAAVLVSTAYNSCFSRRNLATTNTTSAKIQDTSINMMIAGYPVWYRIINNNMNVLLIQADLSSMPAITTGHPERRIINNLLYETSDGKPFPDHIPVCGYWKKAVYYIPLNSRVTLMGWLADDEKEGLILTSSPLLPRGYNAVLKEGTTPAELINSVRAGAKGTLYLGSFLMFLVVIFQVRALDRSLATINPLSSWRIALLGIALMVATFKIFTDISNVLLALLAILGFMTGFYVFLRVTQPKKTAAL